MALALHLVTDMNPLLILNFALISLLPLNLFIKNFAEARDPLTYRSLLPLECDLNGYTSVSTSGVPLCGQASPKVIQSKPIVEDGSWSDFLSGRNNETEEKALMIREIQNTIFTKRRQSDTWPTRASNRTARVWEKYLGCHFQFEKRKSLGGDLVLELTACRVKDASNEPQQAPASFKFSRILREARRRAIAIDQKRATEFAAISNPATHGKPKVTDLSAEKTSITNTRDPFVGSIEDLLKGTAPSNKAIPKSTGDLYTEDLLPTDAPVQTDAPVKKVPRETRYIEEYIQPNSDGEEVPTLTGYVVEDAQGAN